MVKLKTRETLNSEVDKQIEYERYNAMSKSKIGTSQETGIFLKNGSSAIEPYLPSAGAV